MRYAGQRSWQIREDRWGQHFDWALWVRAVERIDVPPGGIVPGPLLIESLPEPSPGLDGAVLAREWRAWWRAWWRALCDLPERDAGLRRELPSGVGLDEQSLLGEVLTRRFLEVQHWHGERKRAGLRGHLHLSGTHASTVVAEVERELGRRAKPFVLTIDVLPVADREVRGISETRFLVPEGIRDGTEWAEVLRGLVEPLA
ncbi:MAG TPA: hypothetical protein VJ914_35140 [Pseudonocardiaceae bacterium]|nr:hypothetical protein [Pseudonocardiaceae bacterium]